MIKTTLFFLSAFLLILFGGLLWAQSPVPAGATVDKIATGFQFVEGPLWHPQGFLIFSDIPANTVYKWNPVNGKSSIFYNPSGNSNGLALDLQGNILLCQHGLRRVSRLNADGTETALAERYQGKRLNSPNDLAVKSDGSIYFTDPPYGINASQEELKFYGIFRLSPQGDLILLDKSLIRPNGICFSPDEKKLYVNDSQALRIYVWDVKDDLTITNKKLFYAMTGSGAADGMKTDTEGRLYCSGPGGVWIFSPDGKVIDKIKVPETVTNLNWGDADYRTLYITAGVSVYSIRLDAVGAGVKEKLPSMLKGFELLPNYPNPFNAGTTLSFRLDRTAHVSLSIYDGLGREIKSLQNGLMPAGLHRFEFSAIDNNGFPLPTGIYFCRLQVEKEIQTRKMALIR
ncbi:MAG: SMP-30/gluconolactonase/LRE family protein [candidate division KSB1 bacterium]|nr:SMP-30/gluconolactonase/LRE family protein [candidate division KSB1 bacterium]